MRDKIIVPFTITATYVNTLDTAPYAIASFTPKPTVAVVPVRLEIWREAGTAYTITPRYTGDAVTSSADALYPYRDKGQYAPDENQVAPIWKSDDIIIYDTNALDFSSRTDRNHIYFRFSMDNFLNNPNANGLVVFPIGGQAVRAGNITFYMEALHGVSGGTGSLVGRIFFDEYPVRW